MITKTLAKLLIQEHKYKPISGNVLQLGRQSINFNESELTAFFQKELGATVNRKTSAGNDDINTELGKRHGSVSDQRFFQMFGVGSLSSMDVTGYEGANIIHDLNYPVPEELHGKFDFIIDGGTFDHLVDIRTAFINVMRMLKTGGRVFGWNAASNFTGTAAYCSFGANLFYDFYATNKFADVKVFIANVPMGGGTNDMWKLWEYFPDVGFLRCPQNLRQVVIVLAEKAPDSTYDAIPVVSVYRPKLQQDIMQSIYDKYKASARPLLIGQKGIQLKDSLRPFLYKIVSKVFFGLKVQMRDSIKSSRSRIVSEAVSRVVKGSPFARNWRYVGRV
jgi:hypothetical protein